MREFTYTSRASRIVFGVGTLSSLQYELSLHSSSKPLILTTPEQRSMGELIAKQLSGLDANVCAMATMHTPTEVTDKALDFLHANRSDSLISVGGGSTVGLGKALALRTGLAQIAVPTTYAGSEVTPILGETSGGIKKTIRTDAVLPETVIYDVNLTLTLPQKISAASGINAIAHAAEALYAKDVNPIVSLMAEEGIRSLYQSLPDIASDLKNIDARSKALYGAWLCGTCLGAVSMGLHHKLCHVLGGAFDLPHAETHAVVLPHALSFNAPAVPQVMARIAQAINVTFEPGLAMFKLLKKTSLPVSLEELGMPKEGIKHAVDLVMRDAYSNPRPLDTTAVHKLITNAFYGKTPE